MMKDAPPGLDILFIAGFGPIVSRQDENRRLFVDTLGLPLKAMAENPDYLHTEKLDGAQHFAIWPLEQASQSCFGTPDWPKGRPVPQCWLEFDVADLERATAVLKEAGYELLVEARKEPWGQTVTRFLNPEGMLLALTHTPWLRDEGG